MKEAGVAAVQSNCIRCHEDQVTDAALTATVDNHKELRTDRKCWECHQEVPHGSVHSLSSVKYYCKIPEDHQETIPDWLNKFLKESDNQKNKENE